jgi:hypothetical protein
VRAGTTQERDIDLFIDSIFDLATCAFDEALAPFVNAFVLAPIVKATNALVAQKLNHSGESDDGRQCVAQPTPTEFEHFIGTIVALVAWVVLSALSVAMVARHAHGGGVGGGSGWDCLGEGAQVPCWARYLVSQNG